ncbi:phosphatidylinositol-specific phospholipase C/glycerophosphodiester phosphodiesterase family protein [Amycolatopsis sp. NPDC059657]|uniref:phosphatidylinositol-specific phospholipase C/glycerophosphodiester phosphodiesterase family protein n=1 Tax=Amycolatopsis sp. NPDC059657 TaxID=3346899 RepID=UPI00366D28E8
MTRKLLAAVLAVLATATLASAPASASHQVRPLAQAHAHNDYEHARPLFDALDQGFSSVEADIFLVDGLLLVGHTAGDLKPDRTLESLYLEPLRKRVLENFGHVYRRPSAFQLLVDIKSEANSTYEALQKRLNDPRYSFLFTTYAFGLVRQGAVTAVLSGSRPKDVLVAQRYRKAFYDGRILDQGDLHIGDDRRVTPLVSNDWSQVFTWTGAGPMPAAERAKLRQITRDAHRAGQKVRFWATPDGAGPDRSALWQEQLDAGVDFLNTDDLSGLANFLEKQ